MKNKNATHSGMIEDNEMGTINFQTDQSMSESVSPSLNATLAISTAGSVGTTGLVVALTISATDLLTVTGTSRTTSTPLGPTTFPCAVDLGSAIDSSTATLAVLDDLRLE